MMFKSRKSICNFNAGWMPFEKLLALNPDDPELHARYAELFCLAGPGLDGSTVEEIKLFLLNVSSN